MLSFDITDRHIRIVKGTENRGKVRISGASTIDLKEGVIINGHIKDIPQMATLINDELKAKKMQDKEAVVSISSNLVIFKELHIPKAKGQQQLLTMVTNQMQHTMGISDDYSISYTIAGEVEEDGQKALKILATACPFEVVKAFRKVFSMLSIGLRSVAVACNTISRVVYADKRLTMKMPLLLVQIDENFLSLNLYENNQLIFSRFTSIDPADYDNPNDYIYEAVNENIFRMLQFQRAQNANDPVQNVIFYGETNEYIRLTQHLEQMEIETALLGVPASVVGYENFEFQEYANAIGAMFRSNKDFERINLLEVDAAAGKSSAGAGFGVALIASAAISAAIVGAIVLFFNIQIDAYKNEITAIDQWMNSEETVHKLTLVDEAQSRVDKLTAYNEQIKLAYKDFETYPAITSEVLDQIFENETGSNCTVDSLSFNTGIWSISCTARNSDGPALFVQNMTEQDIFREISYTGYSLQEAGESGPGGYTFTVDFVMDPQIPEPVTEEEKLAAAAAEAAAASESPAETNAEVTE
jgi:type IV pilus assembly protein PilM